VFQKNNFLVSQSPDLAKSFLLWADARTGGFSAVLEQETDDGKIAPV